MRRILGLSSFAIVLGFLALGRATEKDNAEGFRELFNGKDLTGWKVHGGKRELWGAEKGLLFVKSNGGGWLLTEKEYADFELRLEYRFEKPGGNSGVALRAPETAEVSRQGIEIQLIDDAGYEKVHNYKLKPTQHTGSIYGVVPPSKLPAKRPGEWNQMRIAAKERKITVELNGVSIIDANLDDHKSSVKEHPGLLRTKGRLGVQSHDGRVEFRNLLVKPL